METNILVVDDERRLIAAVEDCLSKHGFSVKSAASATEAAVHLQSQSFDLAFTGLALSDCDGVTLFDRIKRDNPGTEVILIAEHGMCQRALEATKRGAFCYLEKPFEPDVVLRCAERVLESRREFQIDFSDLAVGGDFYDEIVGQNPKMRLIYETIETAAGSDASVLIEGESGTGKELIANAFHRKSNRSKLPLICINCAAIPHELIEAELFGYKRGAFTGAICEKRGLIEAASGGTLFLDEIAEMPPFLQPKLLRVLEQRKLRRLGEEEEIDVDFRLISATNRDTATAIDAGILRRDLFYRISTIRIMVPPLRERLDDLGFIAERLVQRYSDKYDKRITCISEEALKAIMSHSWPGNVRELENVIEHAVIFSGADQILLEHLPQNIRGIEPAASPRLETFDMPLEEIERRAIEQTLERTGGNIKKTAEILHLHRQTLYRKLKAYNLKRGWS